MTIVVAQSILIIIVAGIVKLNPAEEIGMIQCSVDYPKIILINMKNTITDGGSATRSKAKSGLDGWMDGWMDGSYIES